MKAIFTIILFTALQATAQLQTDFIKKVKEIPAMERQAYDRLTQTGNLTGASANFDVKYYRCEWEVDPAVRFITGKVTVYYIVTANASDITLDVMSPLVVDSVKQRNTQLTKIQTSNTLQINFPSAVNTGTLDSVSIYYKGIPAPTGFGSFIQDVHAGTPIMWSLSEPYGARDWWPCKNGNDDKADSIDIIITAPSQYKAASNGLLQSETLIAAGTKKVTHWKHRYPIATYLICFAVTNYTVFNNTVQLGNVSLPVTTYCYPESNAFFQAQTHYVLEEMQYYHNVIGDYPFINEKYGHVQFGWGGGMEHQTSTFIVVPYEGLMAHELAHQWFGDKITCGSWEDIWLNEGFATHMTTGIWAEKQYPDLVVNFRKDEINEITSLPGGSVKVDDTTNVNRIFDGRLTYYKGSHLLHMLRLKLTDSVFFKAIRAYQKDPKLIYGFARTSDLKRHLEQASGKDLTEFFNDWFTGQGYPSYNVEWTPVGSNRVRVKINQTTSHPSVNFFELPVPIKFKNATQQKTVVFDNTSNSQEFFENIGFVADSVFIDPDYWLISKNNIAVKTTDKAPQNTVQVFPNPIQSQFAVYLRNMAAPSATINLYNAAGQLLSSQKINLVSGSQYVDVPSQHLPSGVYTLRVTTDNFKYTKKLLK
jgi:aminopeptidase N